MIKSGLNLRHIRAFCEVVRLGSISAASDHIHLTQPAITQAVKKMEILLETPLVIRSSTGIKPNEQGKLFHERAMRILSLIDLGVQKSISEEQRRTRRPISNFSQLLTLGHLRVLISLNDTLSFSVAAHHMSITQPSLYRIARDLERLADIPFFKSVGKSIELTKAALSMSEYARLALVEIDQAVAELRESLDIHDTVIKIGTLPLVRTRILPLAINQFSVQFPQSVISVTDGPYDDLLDMLRKGQLDFLIGALRDKTPVHDISQTHLFKDQLAIYGRKNHPLANTKRPSVAELSKYPWIVPRRGAPTREYFDKFWEKASMSSSGKSVKKPNCITETSSLILIRGLITDSDRLTMISSRQIAVEEQSGFVTRLNVKLSDNPRSIGITLRKDWQPTKIQSMFIKLIKEICAEDK